MVQFGKKLLESQFEPWAEHYLDYKGLKKTLPKRTKKKKKGYPKLLSSDDANIIPPPPSPTPGTSSLNQDNSYDVVLGSSSHQAVGSESPFLGSPQLSRGGSFSEQQQQPLPSNDRRDFETYLEDEVEKIGLFFLQVQGNLASDLAELRKKQAMLAQQEPATAILSVPFVEEGNVDPFERELEGLYVQYQALAVLLLHLIHFVDSNVTGIRKILKKHDKITRKHLTYEFVSKPRTNSRQLKHLWSDMLLRHYQGITALNMTLKIALTELKNMEYQQNNEPHAMTTLNSSLTLPGFQSHEKNGAGHHPNAKPPLPRHQKHLTMPNIVLPPEDLAQAAMLTASPVPKSRTPQVLTSKKPYGSITKSVVNQNTLANSASSSHELDTILLKVEAARRRLNISSNTFTDLLAAQIMLEPTGFEEDLGEMDEADEGDEADSKWLSHLLNLSSTFLYMTNYYVVAPTSGHYAKMLGGNEALAGIIIGMTPIAALVSTILYSWWTSHSYKAALLFASTCSILGNIFYAIALPCNSLTLVMVGRLLNGFGSARSINRRYIADTFPPRQRTAASAHFVTAGALGMAAGPAIASLLHIGIPDNDFRTGTVHKHIEETIFEDGQEPVSIVQDYDTKLHNNINVWWTPENAPGWFMLVAWSIFWVLLWIHFEDPPKHVAQLKTVSKDVEMSTTKGENQALLSSERQDSNSDNDEEGEDAEIPLWRNIPVMTTFAVYFVLKLILECLLSSTATLTSFYFDWDSSITGIYLAVLGLLMLPANLAVAFLARNHDDKELILGCQVAMLLGCCGIIQYTSKEGYTATQYVVFSVVVFLSTNALEGPNMSLLSQTIPKSWSQGIFNVGLLATEAGTLGRAVGDLMLSAWGFKGLGTLLNITFRTMSIFSGLSLALTLFFFEHLEPHEKDD